MKFVDSDSHYHPIEIYDLVDKNIRSKLPVYYTDNLNKLSKIETPDLFESYFLNSIFRPGLEWNQSPGGFNIDDRIKDLAKLGVDFQILNCDAHYLKFNYLIDDNLAREQCYSANRILQKHSQKFNEKFSFTSLIPLQDIEWSLSEIQWAKKEQSAGIILDILWPNRENLLSLPITAGPIDEIFSLCEKIQLPIIFHGFQHLRWPNQHQYFRKIEMTDLFPSPYRVFLLSLLKSKLLEKYPFSQILVEEMPVHDILYCLQYLDIKKLNYLKYFRENLYFTVDPEDERFLDLIKIVGADRLLWATDYPHLDPGGINHWKDKQTLLSLDITDREKELLSGENARTIFKLNI